MSDKRMKVLEALFKKANGMMGARACTDVENHIQAMLSQEEWEVLFREMHEASGEPEPYRGENYLGCNWWIAKYLFDEFKKDIEYFQEFSDSRMWDE